MLKGGTALIVFATYRLLHINLTFSGFCGVAWGMLGATLGAYFGNNGFTLEPIPSINVHICLPHWIKASQHIRYQLFVFDGTGKDVKTTQTLFLTKIVLLSRLRPLHDDDDVVSNKYPNLRTDE